MTVYANLVDGQVKGVYDLIPKFWNGINNFNILCQQDENFMRQNNFVKIIRDTTQYNPETHKMSDFPTYTVENNEVYEHREIIPAPVAPTPTPEQLLDPIRAMRDQLMRDFEWRYNRYFRQQRLGLPTTDNIQNLDNYMQALADVTTQEDPSNIIWPEYNSN